MFSPRIGRRLLIVAILLALGTAAAIWVFRNAGRWLVVEDPLAPARAIVVLSGCQPYRAMQAAEIFRQGWAPEVWLLKDDPRGASQAFARLGVQHVAEEEYDRQVLVRLGVPAPAIRILEVPATNTLSETTLIAGELRRLGGDRVILVTSPLHTRRAKALWRIAVGERAQAVLRYDSSEPTDPEHWWHTTQDIEAVVHEFLGLVNLRLGFVAKPRTQ